MVQTVSLAGAIKVMTLFDQKHVTEQEDTTSPEHYLWVNVLTKAAHDALYCSDWRESRMAIEWFKRKGSNFKKVCEYAGKNPDYVYHKMIEQIQQRELEMKSVKHGSRLYVKDNERFHRSPKFFFNFEEQHWCSCFPKNIIKYDEMIKKKVSF